MTGEKDTTEIRKRLIAYVQGLGLSSDRERLAVWTVEKISPQLVKIIDERVRAAAAARQWEKE